MHTEHVVFKTHVDHAGRRHDATYFIENRTIHAFLNGRTLLLPIGRMPPDETVEAVLKGLLAKKSGREDLLKDLLSIAPTD